mmetsp:Transcript_28656/g.73191  ORF Transcript_28656/g.73191 Transcript_28656/m.73191 type:complete len:319 (+) Transcript_28656:3004-3960(+)
MKKWESACLLFSPLLSRLLQLPLLFLPSPLCLLRLPLRDVLLVLLLQVFQLDVVGIASHRQLLQIGAKLGGLFFVSVLPVRSGAEQPLCFSLQKSPNFIIRPPLYLNLQLQPSQLLLQRDFNVAKRSMLCIALASRLLVFVLRINLRFCFQLVQLIFQLLDLGVRLFHLFFKLLCLRECLTVQSYYLAAKLLLPLHHFFCCLYPGFFRQHLVHQLLKMAGIQVSDRCLDQLGEGGSLILCFLHIFGYIWVVLQVSAQQLSGEAQRLRYLLYFLLIFFQLAFVRQRLQHGALVDQVFILLFQPSLLLYEAGYLIAHHLR